jgi:hypothetical protein
MGMLMEDMLKPTPVTLQPQATELPSTTVMWKQESITVEFFISIMAANFIPFRRNGYGAFSRK